jgi:hypothetical protein
MYQLPDRPIAACPRAIGIVKMEKYLAGKITGGYWPSLREKKYFLMIRRLLVLSLFVPLDLFAQFTYIIDQTIPVKDQSGEQLLMPWAGGLNAAQHNVMDLNEDGKDDLVIYDRTADRIITFLNEDNQYNYAPEYQNYFPSDITNWLLLRDFNCDGKKDIFTGHSLGIKVYINVTGPGEDLSWKHYVFRTGFGSGTSPVLLTKGFTAKINLQLQFDDLPAFIDADEDGDLDIFNVRFVGNGTVEYHQNFSMERYGTCDSLDFERITQQWGGFTECTCGVFAFNNEDCPPGGRTKHAGGKSLLMIDVDGDADLDVLFSEASCRSLALLENKGTTLAPVISTARSFPPGVPANFSIYPAAFYEDLDFDGKKDLVAIPNIFSRGDFDTNLSHSNWFYKNNGSTASPNFSFTKTNFLQDQMIDVGDNAVPAFADYDADGDYDMFISHNLSDEGPARIALYENTGTSTAPEFTLANSDMWEISQYFLYNLRIQLVDLNADAAIDLAFTATQFQSGMTRRFCKFNKSDRGLDFSGQTLIEMGDIELSYGENVFYTDVNKDGAVDILMGKATGSLQYWRNVTDTGLTFTLEDDSYLGLGQTVLRQNIACFTSDLDGNGKTDLLLADQSGILKVVSDFREATDASGAVELAIFNPLSNEYESKNLGGRIWPAASNLFESTKPTLIIGTTLGGVSILRHDGGESLPETPTIEVYPNPLSKDAALTIKIDRPGTLQIFSMLGQEITLPLYLPANEDNLYRMPYTSAGVYILKFLIDNRSFTRRIVIY